MTGNPGTTGNSAMTGNSATTGKTGLHTTFSEVMAGPCRLDGTTSAVNGTGGAADRRTDCRLELDVDIPEVLHPLADVRAHMRGRVLIPGLADDPRATGSMHIAPLTRKRIRYQLEFTATDGRRLHLDGWKSVSYLHPVRSMTTLPATITDDSGAVVAEVVVRFDIPRRLWPMLRTFRLRRGGRGAAEPSPSGSGDLLPRWEGKPGKLEVWYTTLTDPATGTGVWLHHELVAPREGGPPRVHGWATVFPPGEPPRFARFGPDPWSSPRSGHAVDTPGALVAPDTLKGNAGEIEWDLTSVQGSGTLFTFPRWAWRTGLLPGAQVVPQPSARFDGTIRYGQKTMSLRGAPGATAHIYGHGNAHRWAWLHADLGDGDVAEVVAAVSTRPGLRHLPPLAFVRLRVDGRDWPSGDTLLAALRLRAEIDLPTWRVSGRVGDYRLHIEVTQPDDGTVAVDYTDPDGSTAVCRNSERSDARIVLERRTGGQWQEVRQWHLDGTAHAEVGSRE